MILPDFTRLARCLGENDDESAFLKRIQVPCRDQWSETDQLLPGQPLSQAMISNQKQTNCYLGNHCPSHDQ